MRAFILVRSGPASLHLAMRKQAPKVMFLWLMAQKKMTTMAASTTFHVAMGSNAGGMVKAQRASMGPNLGYIAVSRHCMLFLPAFL